MKALWMCALAVPVLLSTAAAAHARITTAGNVTCAARPSSAIEHLVIIVQENHSFDSYFGTYCKARPGSNPRCTKGPKCCEGGPETDRASGASPVLLTDAENADYSPDHGRGCEEEEIHGGRMDRFVSGNCGNHRNFAYADPATIAPYWNLASRYAMADRYFQPIIGASSANDMYLARAGFVFNDNEAFPPAVGSRCGGGGVSRVSYQDATIGDLLSGCGVSWAFYAEGYAAMRAAEQINQCPSVPRECEAQTRDYPCTFDPSDVPFEYYPTSRDNPEHMKDFADFGAAIKEGRLPSVTYIKPLGFRSEHPGSGITITEGERFVTSVVDLVLGSAYAQNTLVLITTDESGGYFDHVSPPAASRFDGQPYGPRIPLIAVGRFARAGEISHVTMEHSSLVKFIEWNWLGGRTGQLRTRDAEVNNIGSLLDPNATRTRVPLR